MALVKVWTDKNPNNPGGARYVNPDHVIELDGNDRQTTIVTSQQVLQREGGAPVSNLIKVEMSIDEVAKLLNAGKSKGDSWGDRASS